MNSPQFYKSRRKLLNIIAPTAAPLPPLRPLETPFPDPLDLAAEPISSLHIGAAAVDEYNIERKKWNDVAELLNKPFENRSQNETLFLSHTFKQMKFFEHIPTEVVEQVSQCVQFVRVGKNTPLLDMGDWLTPELIEKYKQMKRRFRGNGTEAKKGTSIPGVEQRNQKFFVITNGTVVVVGLPHERTLDNVEEQEESPVRAAALNRHTERTAKMMEHGKILCQLSKGSSFGEYCVNTALEREGRYMWIAREETEVLSMDIDKYSTLLQPYHEQEIESRVQLLRALLVPIFKGYPTAKLYELAKATTLVKESARKVLIKQGDFPATRMFFLRKGECKVIKHIEVTETVGLKLRKCTKFFELATLKEKEYFGELGLLNLQPRQVSIFTVTSTELLVLSKIDFSRFMDNMFVDRFREYAKGYPKDSDLLQIYRSRKKWQQYKDTLMQNILSGYQSTGGTQAKPVKRESPPGYRCRVKKTDSIDN